MGARLRNLITAARGDIPPDLVVKGGKVVNVFSREVMEADVAIYEGVIVGVGEYHGPRVLDARGLFLAPGFIDGHFHIESSMLSPRELACALVPCGTTGIVADPHEIANVLGARGIRYILDRSEGLPLDIYLMLPSCVPATSLETAGAALTCEDLKTFEGSDRVLGLAEMMNYPGVIAGDREVLEKIEAFAGRVLDGHAPLLTGKLLNAYITAGLHSDHECTHLEEAREKLRLGMHIMIREGTQAKNLRDLIPLVNPDTVSQCSLVSDDLHPHDLLHKGHLNYLIDLAVGEGLDPLLAIHMVTLSPAKYFGLKQRGAIAPGYRADIVLLPSLHPITVETVLKNGVTVYENGTLTAVLPEESHVADDVTSMHVQRYGPHSFIIPAEGTFIRVIRIIPGQILTRCAEVKAPRGNGEVVVDTGQDLLKIAVVERHRGTGNIGLGMVQGFGLKKGALASSVAHDSHNIICIGCNDLDIFTAVKWVEERKGGMVVVHDGQIKASLSLPVAGLLSDMPFGRVAECWENINREARLLGCTVEEPFMALSFLALPVIPELRITDRGLVDVQRFTHVPLFLSE